MQRVAIEFQLARIRIRSIKKEQLFVPEPRILVVSEMGTVFSLSPDEVAKWPRYVGREVQVSLVDGRKASI